MSHFGLVPFFPRWFDDIERTHTLFDQFFGQDLFDSDLMGPLNWYPGGLTRARMFPEGQAGPLRPSFDRARSGISRVINDKNEFKVCLDVQQFKPEEITVKTVSDSVVIEGKHEEKEDEHGYIKRHFVRRYMLPEGVKPESVKSTLSSDGVLSVSAPKQPALEAGGERVVPISHSPHPAISSGGEKKGQQQQGGGEGQKMEP